MNEQNETDEAVLVESAAAWEQMSELEREYYFGVDITAASMDPADISRAWKVLVVYRDIALEHNDFQRVTLYCAVLEDLATMLQALNFPMPPVLNTKPGEQPSERQTAFERALAALTQGLPMEGES